MNNPLALNPFKKGKKTEVEGIRDVNVESLPNLENMVEYYDGLKEKEGKYSVQWETQFNRKKINLSLKEIDLLTQYVISKGSFKNYFDLDHGITTTFLSRLIQDSYNKGNNDFVFNFPSTELCNFAYDLMGLNKNPIKITINGDVGNNLGHKSSNVDFVINGNVGERCGLKSNNCSYLINGNADLGLGCSSTSSFFIVKGNCGGSCGYNAEAFKVYLHKDVVGFDRTRNLPSKNSVYNVYTKENFVKLSKDFPGLSRLYLRDKNDNILEELRNDQEN